MQPNIFRVNLRYNERHMRFHSKGRRIVDHDCVSLTSDWHKFPRDIAARAKKCDVDLIERSVAEFMHRNPRTPKLHGFSRRARGADRTQTRYGKTSPLEHLQQLLAHRTGRADDRDMIPFHAQGDSIAAQI